jgi:hypothetical protein
MRSGLVVAAFVAGEAAVPLLPDRPAADRKLTPSPTATDT